MNRNDFDLMRHTFNQMNSGNTTYCFLLRFRENSMSAKLAIDRKCHFEFSEYAATFISFLFFDIS